MSKSHRTHIYIVTIRHGWFKLYLLSEKTELKKKVKRMSKITSALHCVEQFDRVEMIDGIVCAYTMNEKTRLFERLDNPQTFGGSYRQLVVGRIHGAHHKNNKRTRQGASSSLSVY